MTSINQITKLMDLPRTLPFCSHPGSSGQARLLGEINHGAGKSWTRAVSWVCICWWHSSIYVSVAWITLVSLYVMHTISTFSWQTTTIYCHLIFSVLHGQDHLILSSFLQKSIALSDAESFSEHCCLLFTLTKVFWYTSQHTNTARLSCRLEYNKWKVEIA